MKKTALLAATAAMFTATPAIADVGGYVGLEYTATEFSVFATEDIEGVDAEFSLGFTGEKWGAQIEGALSNTEFSNIDLDMNTLAGHLWYGGDRWRLGGMIARSELPYFDEVEWAYGVEGTFDLTPNAVLWATYSQGEIYDYDTEASNIDLGARYYVTPNLRLGAALGLGDYDFGDTSTYRLNAEYQTSSLPLSFTLGWSKFDLKDSSDQSESLSIGVRWNFGTATLRGRDNLNPFDYSMGYSARIDGVY